jgi:hypothetical protein
MLVAHGWEVQHIHVPGLVDFELKLAVRMYTVEQPYPLYRSFNNPFNHKVQATHPHNPILRSSPPHSPPSSPPLP